MEILSEALSINSCLEYLDLFDVEFGNFGAISLSVALNNPKSSVKNIRLANTHVTTDAAERLIQAV